MSAKTSACGGGEAVAYDEGPAVFKDPRDQRLDTPRLYIELAEANP